jgi:uncharacterized phage-associated protein
MNIREQKIINAIIYFVKNTRNCKKTKLFKLLYYLDFMHFKRFGLSVTGYNYITMPYGPVPEELLKQFEKNEFPDEFNKNFTIEKVTDEEDKQSFQINLKNKKPDLDWFTPNELTVLNEVVEIFKDAPAKDIVEATHFRNTPWDKTVKTKGIGSYIDYFLALDEDTSLSREEIEERFNLQKQLSG